MTSRFSPHLLVTMILLLSACGKNSSGNSDNNAPNPELPTLPSSDGVAENSPVIPPLVANNPESLTPTPVENSEELDATNIVLKPLGPNGVPEGFSSWDEFNSPSLPETSSLLILDGIDPVKDLTGDDSRCSIYVLAAYLDASNQATYVLRSSFNHNDETHPYLLLPLSNPSSLSAVRKSQSGRDEIFIKFSEAGNISSASSFNLKWLHINHYDTGVCESLKIRSMP